MNFLEALLERHRMPAIFRIRTAYEQLWDEEENILPVEITSAIELEKGTVDTIGERIHEQTGRKVELSSKVDPEIIGGIVLRVGELHPRCLDPQPTESTSQASSAGVAAAPDQGASHATDADPPR